VRRYGAVAVLLVLAGATAAAIWAAADRDGDDPPATRQAAKASSARDRKPPRRAGPLRLVPHPAGSLSAPVQDAALAVVGRRIVLLGGLDSADTSTAEVRLVSSGHARTIARLPMKFHDGAAVRLGSSVYELGGGDGVRQLDQILRVNPRTGAATRVGSLPAPSSDHAAAVLAGSAYVVGGYTGRVG
jgi:hypothetical protein